VEQAIYDACALMAEAPLRGHSRPDLTSRPLRFWTLTGLARAADRPSVNSKRCSPGLLVPSEAALASHMTRRHRAGRRQESPPRKPLPRSTRRARP
jgi:hypothetical protein